MIWNARKRECVASRCMGARSWERVRALGPPNWASIASAIEEQDLPLEEDDVIEAQNGWLCGDDIDTPCTLYLVRASGFVVHNRPDTLAAESVEWVCSYGISEAGAGRNDSGDPRLVIVWTDDDDVPRGVAIDFERAHQGFVDQCAGHGISWSRGPGGGLFG